MAVDPWGINSVDLAVLDGAVGLAQQQQALIAIRRAQVVCDGCKVGCETGRGAFEVADLELAVGGCERVGLQGVGAVGVAFDQLRERVALELGTQVHAGRASQVVETVAVLEVLQRGLEDVVEGAAQQATEQVGDLSQTTDPQVDALETGGGHTISGARVDTRAVHEIERISVGVHRADDVGRRGTLVGQSDSTSDAGMRAIGGHEVDQRFWVLEVLTVVSPTGVRGQLPVAGAGEHGPSEYVQRRDAFAAGPGHVEHRQVQRQTQQVVPQGFGDELVELVTDLVR